MQYRLAWACVNSLKAGKPTQPFYPRQMSLQCIVKLLIRSPELTIKPLRNSEILGIISRWAIKLCRYLKSTSHQSVIHHRLNRLCQEQIALTGGFLSAQRTTIGVVTRYRNDLI